MPRTKGSKNKDKVAFREKMEAFGCDIEEILFMAVTNTSPCPFCAPADKRKEACEACEGSGIEIYDQNNRTKLIQTIIDRLHPKLASKTVDKNVRRMVVARLNHMADEEQDEVNQIIEGESGEVDED